MGQWLAYILVAVVGWGALRTYWAPQISLALYWGLYGVEQIFIGNFALFGRNTTAFNYLVGVICVWSVVVAIARRGFPKRVDVTFYIFAAFAGYVLLSILWTEADAAAVYAARHFVAEAFLAVYLPLFVIRRETDLVLVARNIAIIGVLVALYLLVAPVSGVGGRNLLVEGGTVLSPASLMGGAAILALSVGRRLFYGGDLVRYLVVLVLLLGCFLSGARTQFYMALLACGVIYMHGRLSLKSLLSMTAVIALMLLAASSFLFDEVLDVANNTAERYALEEFSTGLESRLQMIRSTLVFDRPVVGHGLMGWAYWVAGKDAYLYPHNSLAQVYFELGLIGLFLFVALLARGLFLARKLYLKSASRSSRTVCIGIFMYFVYGFVLSLKQGTFMSCLDLYLGLSLLATLARLPSRNLFGINAKKIRSGT